MRRTIIIHCLVMGLMAAHCLPPLAYPAYAAASRAEGESARDAFLFAGRKDWGNALLHAKRSRNPALIKLIHWQYLLDMQSGASFEEYTHFIQHNPRWPEQRRLRIRAEQSLKTSVAADRDLIAWFEAEGDARLPITGVGKVAYAEALSRLGHAPQEKIDYLIRDAWRNGDFDESQEQAIAQGYGHLFTHEDEISRIDRLLWEQKTGAANRMLNRVPPDYQRLFKARIALIGNDKNAPQAVAAVSSSLSKEPGLLYDRMMYRAKRDDSRGVREILLAAPTTVPYPEKWWRQRERQVREAIDEDNYALAQKLLANHAQVDGSQQADALWLQGWIYNEFLKQPKRAYDVFYRMYNNVRYPVSRARAAYWAGRAAHMAGDQDAAANWYNTASAYPTTFYGQLASVKYYGSAPLHIPAPPVVTAEDRKAFEANDMVKAIRLCVEAGNRTLAASLLSHLIETAGSDEQIALAAGLGARLNQPYLGVRGAKKALQENIVLVEGGYPRPKTPANLYLERPLTLAITRQESEFDQHAVSRANAMGLMQLLPSTAKETARKNGLPYNNKSQLFEANYNMTLGSLYLAKLIHGYDGSYVMAIAAYNGGPGNVRKWTQRFGTPGNTIDTAVNWIEKIPFAETRNYVQRVLENVQVYRHLEAGGAAPKLRLGEDLMR